VECCPQFLFPQHITGELSLLLQFEVNEAIFEREIAESSNITTAIPSSQFEQPLVVHLFVTGMVSQARSDTIIGGFFLWSLPGFLLRPLERPDYYC
jgi:hypothetical protein